MIIKDNIGKGVPMFVISHRGANRFAPQNTLAAFIKAAQLGADGVETDVRVTRDGHMVLCHNETVNGTSDGKGKVRDQYLGELFNYDFGSWFGGKFENTVIPTIDDFLGVMKENPVDILDIEIKPNKNENDFVERIIKKVREYGMIEKLIVSSFDEGILKKVKEIDSSVKTGYLYPSTVNWAVTKVFDPVKKAKEQGFDFLLPHSSYASKKLIDKAHEQGVKVACWTVNKLETLDKLYSWGADGVITDYPDIMKNKLESY